MPDLIPILAEGLSAAVNPLGAELWLLRDAEGRDLLWNGDPAFWTFRAPLLFPFVGVLAEDRYRIGETVYPMTKHGFARRKPFEVVEAGPSRAVFRLEPDEETRGDYPFEFRLEVTFTAAGRRLEVEARVSNAGHGVLPASFGFHPAFLWPPPGGVRGATRIVFEEDEPEGVRRLDGDGLLRPERLATPVEGRSLWLKDELFENDALIFDRIRSRSARLESEGASPVQVLFPDTELLGVWTKPGAPFICIEPWHGHADPEGFKGDVFTKPAMFILPPGGAKTLTLAIEV